MTSAHPLIAAARALTNDLRGLRFAEPVTHVYNPLVYAWPIHEAYVRRFGSGRKKVVFLGMNPGPFGMAQTGVPFGEIAAVRDWMGLTGAIGRPDNEHPKRPITGFACTRSEVSGRRLYGLFARRFGTPERFFADHFIANYCPLVFMQAGGKNHTPDQLPARESDPISQACDRHLAQLVAALQPAVVVGVGRFAASCAARVLGGSQAVIATIPHPSPANPSANKDWAGLAESALVQQGVWAAHAN
jgi:single-strand selective monofunctional uracil DNA glycosylase